MKRQHFSGDHWKGKDIPESQTRSYLNELMKNKPEEMPKKDQEFEGINIDDENIDKSEENWEKVRR